MFDRLPLLRNTLIFFVLLTLLVLPLQQVAAQALGVAEYIAVETGTDLPTGSLISLRDGNYRLTQEPYSKNLFGVVTTDPAVELQPDTIAANEYPVVKQGSVTVRVNGESGSIAAGDLVTSSSTTGEAMKAAQSGFVLGVAQGDFEPSEPDATGTIPVLIDMKFAFAEDSPSSDRIISRMMSLVSLSTVSFVEEPVQSLRYTVAALVVLVTLALSFFTFGRVAYKGVEALGRNPLAQRSITIGIIINTTLGIGLGAVGMIIAYVIVIW